MASIMEELTSVLEEEFELYNKFIPICREKTTAIVKNQLDEIQTITVKEQEFLDRIGQLEKKREECIGDIANVTGTKLEDLNIAYIIRMLDKQPEEQKKLSIIHDNLKTTTRTLVDINNHNTSLIKQSLEMIEFNMNFMQSTWTSPGNNNYDRAAKTDYSAASVPSGMFDAKQ